VRDYAPPVNSSEFLVKNKNGIRGSAVQAHFAAIRFAVPRPCVIQPSGLS